MAQFAASTFTGTAGTELSSADANWTRHASSSSGCNLVITDANAVRTDGSNGAALYYHAGAPASADYSASVDITKLTALSTAAGTTVRHSTSANTFYLGRYEVGSDSWQLFKAVAGTFTQLGSNVAASFSNGTTKNIKVEAIGTAIKVYVEGSGTPSISVTDSSITAAGKAGLRYGYGGAPVATNTTGLHLDNFSGDDAGAGTTIALNPATETDTAQPVGKVKFKAIGQALSADTALAITPALVGATIVAVGQAVESDLAQAVAASKLKAVGQASEADTAQAIAPRKVKAIGQALETDSAQAITSLGTKTIAVGLVTETDFAQAIAAYKRLGILQPVETDSAHSIAAIKRVAVGQAIETDAAQAMAVSGGAARLMLSAPRTTYSNTQTAARSNTQAAARSNIQTARRPRT